MQQSLFVKTTLTAVFFSASFFLTGCSINMAASGKENPKIEEIKPGALRSIVEAQLGKPVHIDTKADGSFVAEYLYEVDDRADPTRAAAYGAMDVMTLGLWELFGTPIEASRTGLKKLKINFNRQQRVTKVFPPQDTEQPTKDRIAYWANKV